MSLQNSQTFMDQRIFELGLSKETISVYLLCTGLADSDKPLTADLLLSIWSGSQEGLEAGLKKLEGLRILEKVGDPAHYRILAHDEWAIH